MTVGGALTRDERSSISNQRSGERNERAMHETYGNVRFRFCTNPTKLQNTDEHVTDARPSRRVFAKSNANDTLGERIKVSASRIVETGDDDPMSPLSELAGHGR
jgi:hypothetical protein